MEEVGREQDNQGQDWQRVDARILGQILAAQNFLFVLPDEARIAEFFSEALSEVPGVTSCLVCLGDLPAPVGVVGEVCRECVTLRKKRGGMMVMPPNFSCRLAARPDWRVIPLGTTEHTFGFFILRIDSGDVFEPYWPFLNNLANYVALSLENRMQKLLLEKARDELEDRVKKRTEELMTMNILLEEEIQERRLAEETLLKEKERAQSYLDIAGVIFVGLNEAGQIVLINKKGCEILGYQEADLIGRDWFTTCLPPAIAATIKSNFLKIISGEIDQFKDYENPVLTKSGEERIIDWRNSVLRDKDGKIIGTFSSGEDITERKQAEEELRRMNERFSLAARAARLGVWDWDLQKNELVWDDRMYQLYGVKREDFAGAYEAWLKGVHPDDRASSDEISKQAQRGEREYDTEFRVVWPNGSIHYLKAYGQFVRDADGRPLRMTGVNYDITVSKQAEEEIRRLNQNLEQRVVERTAQLEAANKELEAFAYSVSHDLRAPLRHIDGFLELLKQRMTGALDERSQHYMATISDSARRMGQLIDDLLAFSRMGRNEMVKIPVDLAGLVQEVVREFEPETQGRAIHWRITPLPTVSGDRAMLRLALVNLLSNALKFTRGRPQVDIEIGCQVGEKEIIVFIRDNGVGFDRTYADKLFGVFQRLHRVEEFEGTGIGLANVRRIIQRHGGRTWAEGEVNRGATFYFSLPQVIQET